MILVERIETLSERASRLDQASDECAESRRLQGLLGKAGPMNVSLGQEVQQMRLFHDEGINAPVDTAQAGSAHNTVEKLLERFSEERRAENLTRGKGWTSLEERVRGTCADVATCLKAAWRQFVDIAYSGESPSDLERSLAVTARNVEQLKLYKQAYTELKSLARTRPKERTDFNRVRELARRLSEIHQGFDFDVPDDVKLFLSAVADGGADLTLLTQGVRDWLQQQNTSDLYRIVARTDSK